MTTNLFDHSFLELLEDRVKLFYGYGTYTAKYWFIGMEEGGGNTYKDIQKRMFAWQDRGKHTLEDLAAYHGAIDCTDYFDERRLQGQIPRLQSTWNKLIRILLRAEKRITDDVPAEKITYRVRDYQSRHLGLASEE